jgi:hypothetical protein
MEDTRCIIDLSQALSQRLGKQMSMMSTYRVNHISIQLINVNDTISDNNGAAQFSGRIHYHHPTSHKINAMQLARQLEKGTESLDIDADSWLLSTDPIYKGIRFNWDSDSQVAYATAEPFSALSGARWDLAELFNVYNQMNHDKMDQAANKLWSSGRTGYTEQLGFTVGYTNQTVEMDPLSAGLADRYQPHSRPFSQDFSDPISVLGGLLMVDFEASSTDSPELVDDDYHVMITVGVSGWSDF